MKTDQDKAKHFFRYNYYQWATPTNLFRYGMVAYEDMSDVELKEQYEFQFEEAV